MNDDLQRNVFELATRLEGKVDQLVDTTIGYMSEVPPFLLEPPLAEEVYVFTRNSIQVELQLLKVGGPPPQSCPGVDAWGARRAAETGTPVSVLVEGYRAGHRAQWEGWLELIEARATLDGGERMALLRRGSDFFFAYAARLSTLVTEEYMRVREGALRGGEQRRMQAVRELLAGRDADGAALQYPLDRHHLGFVVWGPGGRAAARQLGEKLNARVLVLEVGSETWWGWFGLGARASAGSGKALEEFEPPLEAGFALASPSPGVEGFRRSHRQALSAYRAARRLGRRWVRFRDVALEDLAAADEDIAKEFVHAELAGITGRDSRSRRLRETLLAYFASGQNMRATARTLGVHHQTVAQRLRAVEERLGYPIEQRRVELETALRLERMLGLSTRAGLPLRLADPANLGR